MNKQLYNGLKLATLGAFGATALTGCNAVNYNTNDLSGFSNGPVRRAPLMNADISAHRNLAARENESRKLMNAYKQTLDDIAGLQSQSITLNGDDASWLERAKHFQQIKSEVLKNTNKLSHFGEGNAVVIYDANGVPSSYAEANIGKRQMNADGYSGDDGLDEMVLAYDHLASSINTSLVTSSGTLNDAYSLVLDLGDNSKSGAEYVLVFGNSPDSVSNLKIEHFMDESFGYSHLRDNDKIFLSAADELSLKQRKSSTGTVIYAVASGLFSPWAPLAVKAQAIFGGSYDLPNNPNATVVQLDRDMQHSDRLYWDSITELLDYTSEQVAKEGKQVGLTTGFEIGDLYVLVVSSATPEAKKDSRLTEEGSGYVFSQEKGDKVFLVPIGISGSNSGSGILGDSGGSTGGGPQGGN